MSVQFGKLISRIQQAGSPSEREDILLAAGLKYSFTCHQLGMLLMNMRYSSERQAVANLLAPNIVDPENAYAHLLPYIAYESSAVRDTILRSVIETSSAQ